LTIEKLRYSTEKSFGSVDKGFPKGFVAGLSATDAVLLGEVFDPYYYVV
jgi:hypothetical protein